MGMSYVLDDELLGQNITYTGNVISNTIADGYEVKAFVKTLDANYGLINETTAPLDNTGVFAINYNSNNYPGAVHLQYGFSVRGLNANPVNMESNGNVVIGAVAAGTPDFAKNAVFMYPNPATNVLNISAENSIDTIEIYNLLGQMVMGSKPAQNQAAVNVSNLTTGIYIVNTTIAGKQTSARFVKQ
jgi:hypothetical protein